MTNDKPSDATACVPSHPSGANLRQEPNAPGRRPARALAAALCFVRPPWKPPRTNPRSTDLAHHPYPALPF
jgi:hypothetical protein